MGSARRWILSACIVLLALPRCAAPPAVALGPAAPFDPLQQQLALDATLPGQAPKHGNRVTLLRDGTETLPAMFAAIAAARDDIDLEYYVFEDVHVGGEGLGDLLERKLGEGVAVNVIMDGYGSLGAAPEFLDGLKRAGAAILVFHPITPEQGAALKNPNDRDHRKILVVDGRVGFVGGVNLDRVYENRPVGAVASDPDTAYYRDVDARIEGPAVADLQRLFFATWQHEGGPPPQPRNYFPTLGENGDEVVRIVGSLPSDDRPLYYVALLNAVHAARQRIDLTTGYFAPTHQEREELSHAARRGVDVQLVLPAVSDQPGVLAAGRAAYGDLLEAGVSIAEVHDSVLHSKLVAIDGAWTAIGSSNLDRRSVVFNNEVDALILGRATAAAAERVFAADRAAARPVSEAQWRARPSGERIDEFFARFWEWLM
jgi:cardiolipin synthase A/B